MVTVKIIGTYVGVPLLYMLVVAPLGFLVNTETNYYGYVDTSGQIPM